MLPIQVGVCTCDNRVVDKTRFISPMVTYNCEVYRECTVVNPVFILEYNAIILNSNYLLFLHGIDIIILKMPNLLRQAECLLVVWKMFLCQIKMQY